MNTDEWSMGDAVRLTAVAGRRSNRFQSICVQLRSSVVPSFSLLRFLAVMSCAGLLFFYGLGDRDLNSSHEARAAQNAQSILDSGDWLLPRLFDRHIELQKPPLYYWLVAALAWLHGGQVDVWDVRLPS